MKSMGGIGVKLLVRAALAAAMIAPVQRIRAQEDDLPQNTATAESEPSAESKNAIEPLSVRFRLSTGETIIGNIVSSDEEYVEVKNSFSTMRIPMKLITLITPYEALPTPTPQSESSSHSFAYASQNSATDAAANAPSTEVWTPFFGSETSVIGKDDPVINYMRGLRDEYKEFMASILPEGLKINLRTGVVSETTTYEKDSYYFYGSAAKDWETMSISASGFYNYEWQRSAAGVSSVTTDKYGASGNYEWNFLGPQSQWFLTNLLAYRHDSIKNIDRQIDESVGIGYEFEFPSIGLKWQVSIGPGLRYVEAEGFDRHNVPMVFLNEKMSWDITTLLRMEHQGYYGMDLETGTNATAYIMVGLVFAPEEIISIALRLTNDYDSINSATAIKNEQKFMLSVEIPISGGQ